MPSRPTSEPTHRSTTEACTGGRPRRLDRRILPALPAWRLEDAKARFSEVVRRARTEGPQRVTCRGEDAVVVIAVADLEGPPDAGVRPNLVDFLQGTALGGLDLARAEDRGREVPF